MIMNLLLVMFRICLGREPCRPLSALLSREPNDKDSPEAKTKQALLCIFRFRSWLQGLELGAAVKSRFFILGLGGFGCRV